MELGTGRRQPVAGGCSEESEPWFIHEDTELLAGQTTQGLGMPQSTNDGLFDGLGLHEDTEFLTENFGAAVGSQASRLGSRPAAPSRFALEQDSTTAFLRATKENVPVSYAVPSSRDQTGAATTAMLPADETA